MMFFNVISNQLNKFTSWVTNFAKSSFKEPDNINDYYVVGKVMISKRLVNLIFVLLALVSLIYLIITLPEKIKEYSNGNSNRIYTKFYDSRSLKKYNGVAKVISKKNQAQYVGDIVNGVANGHGELYDRESNLLYDGDFVKNEYFGIGTLYNKDGFVRYVGEFQNNEFYGQGRLYYDNHNINYEGTFVNGIKNGQGVLYNNLGLEIFKGTFNDDKPVIEKYLNRNVETLKNNFLEDGVIYTWKNKTCIIYKDLGVMVVISKDTNSLNSENIISQMYVLNNLYFSNESKLNRSDLDIKMDELKGLKSYTGYTRVLFNEMSAIDYLKRLDNISYESFSDYDFNNKYTDVYESKNGSSNDKTYVQSYHLNNLEYTFYFKDKDKDEEYIFYSIERAS